MTGEEAKARERRCNVKIETGFKAWGREGMEEEEVAIGESVFAKFGCRRSFWTMKKKGVARTKSKKKVTAASSIWTERRLRAVIFLFSGFRPR